MSRGETTRGLILDHAVRRASLIGLERLSVGELARAAKLSKSGLFAHFGSKELLQIAVLEEASQRFIASVVVPAIRQPRGEPRVRALYENWLVWSTSEQMPGGCVFVAASAEFDAQPGAVRDTVVRAQRDWHATLERAAALAIDVGHFREDLDPGEFAFEFLGVELSTHQHLRLLATPGWERYSRAAFERLIQSARAERKTT